MIKRTVILGSNSPRRKQLISLITDRFVVAECKAVDETYPADTPPEKVPEYLSQLKAKAYLADIAPDDVLVTADTVVILDDKILGKPHDYDQAVAMLRSLSGRTHKVVTGVTVADSANIHTFSVTTEVTFAPLSDEEINNYVERYQPYDKAGAYGIQEWIGAIGVSEIRGSYYNVMGLPLHRLYQALLQFNP